MAGPRLVPRGFKFWPQQDRELAPQAVQAMYEQGFAGAYAEPVEKAAFQRWSRAQNAGLADGAEISAAMGWAGSGEGQLVVPFIHVEKLFPGCWPASAQTRGDCVSHSTRNAALVTMACDIASGRPDETSGLLEGIPDMPEEGKRDGVLSSEAIYWWRGHGGDGWSCGHASRVVSTQSGMWLRMPYPELGVDLTRYSGSTAGKYGSRNPPAEYLAVGKPHLIRTSTELTSGEQVRDFLKNGYGISSCGGEGWSSSRDENGFSARRGGWSHALAYIGWDERDVVVQRYGGPLVLIMNSWGRWNSGGRRIMGTEIDIPEGSFWALWSACKNRDQYAYSSASGWPSKKLPDYGFHGL